MSVTQPSIGIMIQNDNVQLIPPRSVVIVTSVEIVATGSGQETVAVHHVDKYSGQVGNIFVTGAISLDPCPSGLPTLAGRITGTAYSDQLIYVAIDGSVATPKVMEQWGPIPSSWAIGRGGMGFFCQGYADTGDAARRSIFLRKDGYYLGKLTATLSAATMAVPTSATFNVWHPNPSLTGPGQALIVSPNSSLLGLTAYNYSASNSGSSGYDCIVQMLPTGLTFVSVGCKAS